MPHTPQEIMDRLKTLIDKSPPNIRGKVVKDHVVLDIIGNDVHYWSPQLDFRIEKIDNDESSCTVAGLIGPRPAVWTLFMFVYFAIGIIGFFISMYGMSQYMLGEYTFLIWAFPIALLFIGTIYITAKFGEKKAEKQTEILKQFVREAIYDK